MNNSRGNIIILTYGYLIYHFVSGERHSLFVYLAALLVELVMLLILYVISNLMSKDRGKINIFTVLIGFIPLLLFNYAIIYFASMEVGDVQGWIC